MQYNSSQPTAQDHNQRVLFDVIHLHLGHAHHSLVKKSIRSVNVYSHGVVPRSAGAEREQADSERSDYAIRSRWSPRRTSFALSPAHICRTDVSANQGALHIPLLQLQHPPFAPFVSVYGCRSLQNLQAQRIRGHTFGGVVRRRKWYFHCHIERPGCSMVLAERCKRGQQTTCPSERLDHERHKIARTWRLQAARPR